MNAHCVVKNINSQLLLIRLGINTVKIGDIISEINGINILNTNLADINQILCTQQLHSISNCTKKEWRNRSNRLNLNSQINTSQITEEGNTLTNYGLLISKTRQNSPFKVIHVNKPLIQLQIGKNINVGDIITKINDIEIFNFTNDQVSELLSSIQLHSITNHTNLEWISICRNDRYNRRINSSNNNNQTNSNTTFSTMLDIQWDYDNLCTYCGCLFLKVEKKRDICCNNGLFLNPSSNFPILKPLPHQLKNLLNTRLPHFARNSVSYNNILALGATGVENGSETNGWEYRFGDHCVILHGRTYHFLTNTTGQSGLRYFLFDAQSDMIEHGNRLNQSNTEGLTYERIIPNFLKSIFNELQQINILVNEIENIGLRSRQSEFNNNNHNMIVEINARTSHFDVAAITSDDVTGNRTLTIRRKGSNQTSTISTTDSKLEPLSYPLLFPFGEDGWGDKIRKTIKFPKYLLSRMLMGEKNEDGSPLLYLNKANKLVTTNRFQLMCRLGQTYLVDNLSRAIDFRLSWHKQHQNDIFGIQDMENSEDIIEPGNENNKSEKTFLSQSFHGSRRHLRKLSTNALCIVSEYGRPSLFITLTCNAYWKNITDQLLETQVIKIH